MQSLGGAFMIVQVIVDIPAAQVNRTFDYQVPAKWQSIIQLGIRVQVPFGRRQLLGFVVGMDDTTLFSGELKEITGVLDYVSFLNPELIELSEYLAGNLHAFRISVLQAMLPNMLKVKYENIFIINDLQKFQTMTLEFAEQLMYGPEIEFQKLTLEAILPGQLIKEMIQAEVIELEYRVLNQTTHKKIPYLKPLLNFEDMQAIVEKQGKRSPKQVQLLTYYLANYPLMWEEAPLNEVAKRSGVSTATIKSVIDKGWFERQKRQVYRDPLANQERHSTTARALLPEQAIAFNAVKDAITAERNETFLLEGVTGSGKTEVYLQLMAHARQRGEAAILLVPEISLTPQMVARVTERFSTGVAVLHSGLSTSEKYDEWRRIIKGEATIVVGARSSVFAPLDKLGLIIIDEEHETTYKQADNPRYHARDVALWRCQYHQCPLVLGSATPSLETRSRAEVGRYTLLKMEARVNQAPLPPVEIIDMTQMAVRETSNEFSPLLKEKIRDRLDKKEQIVLLLNRRGYASYLLCRECGYVLECPRCDISLTYHKHDHKMKCHYCDFQQNIPRNCPQCQSTHLRTFGLGTQKVAETLEELYPDARVIRMDNDTTRRKGQHEKLLKQFAEEKADILLGTQMIAKGLDFEKVTLVGVINADTSLNLPDFRAGEKTFQLLTQVAGRTGRGRFAGEVLIQTYNPEHYVMQFAKQHDYEKFFYYEMKRRHIGNYPPYFYTTLISVSSKNLANAQEKIYEIKANIYNQQSSNSDLLILGPSKGPVARINEYYHFQLMLKYKNKELVQSQLNEILTASQQDLQQGLRVSIDHEPLYFI